MTKTDLSRQRRWRADLDESYIYSTEENKRFNKWHYMEIRGRGGVIYPWNEFSYIVLVKSRMVANRLISEGGHKVIRDSDDGVEFIVPYPELDFWAKQIQARKRRKMTPAMLEHLKRVGKPYRKS